MLQEFDAPVPPTPSLPPPSSVRSILRGGKTPGTSNARFLSRKRFSAHSTTFFQGYVWRSFYELVWHCDPKNSRPSSGEIFSPLTEESKTQGLSGQINTEVNTPLASEAHPSDPSNPLDLSQGIDLPALLPGFHLDLNLDSGFDLPGVG
ncbi:hypothetical protein VKT23_007598 [Stygiomarasmius scandens]|uniref:Uncharacterized protein n=1 Tax=Marasmiellus scandens TaxID=2682957 RepID=A0ABR1JKA1_9AGAR